MKPTVVLAFFVLGAAAAGAITLAIQPTPDDPVRATEAAGEGLSKHRLAPADAAEQMRRWVAASLARPLFTPDRRPVEQAPAGANETTGLPRLSGIMITSAGSRAIFAGGGGKPEVVVEGGRVGRYHVQSISIGEVVVIGPDGRHVLRPTFDRASPAGAAAPPIVAGQAAAKEAAQ